MRSALARPTLVLNKNWIAIGCIPVKDALSQVYSGGALVVDPHDRHGAGLQYQQYTWHDWSQLRPVEGEGVVLCVKGPVREPDIIVLTKYERMHSRELPFNRRNLFARDGNTCQYCGKKFVATELSIDHVIPQCQGGRSTWENCLLACVGCNVRKGGRTPRQANMTAIRKPVKPKWSPIFRSKAFKPTWDRFVNEMYWQVELED